MIVISEIAYVSLQKNEMKENVPLCCTTTTFQVKIASAYKGVPQYCQELISDSTYELLILQ